MSNSLIRTLLGGLDQTPQPPSGLKAAGGYKLRIPQGYEGGVAPSMVKGRKARISGIPEEAVSTAAYGFANKAEDAIEGGAIDDIASRVARAAIERGDDTVVADVAAGLMMLPQDSRQQIIGRATELLGEQGRPDLADVFAPLAAEQDQWSPRAIDSAMGAAGDRAMDRAVEGQLLTRDKLPVQQNIRDVMKRDPYLGKRGGLQTGTDFYKTVMPTNKPQGTSPESSARNLMGDQLMQLRRIQESRLTPEERSLLYTDEGERVLKADGTPLVKAFDELAYEAAAAGPEGVPPESDAFLPLVRKPGKGDTYPPPDQTMTVGTGVTGRGDSLGGDPNAKWSRKGQQIDDEVERRLASSGNKPLEALYRAAGGGVVDLDRYFPFWRARYAEYAPDGTWQYPQKALSPEFLTGIIRGVYTPQDSPDAVIRGVRQAPLDESGEMLMGEAEEFSSGVADFYDRMLPVIQRSIEAAPLEPSTARAREFADIVFRPSERLSDAAQKTPLTDEGALQYGADSGLMYRTYSDIDNPSMEPKDAYQPRQKQGMRPQVQKSADELKEQFRRSLLDDDTGIEPGDTDGQTASIRTVRPRSSLAGLLA